MLGVEHVRCKWFYRVSKGFVLAWGLWHCRRHCLRIDRRVRGCRRPFRDYALAVCTKQPEALTPRWQPEHYEHTGQSCEEKWSFTHLRSAAPN